MTTINVDACEMNNKQFKYRCSFGCSQKYHVHGNCGDYETNRVEHRISHCHASKAPTVSAMIAVHITKNTVRKLTPLKPKTKQSNASRCLNQN